LRIDGRGGRAVSLPPFGTPLADMDVGVRAWCIGALRRTALSGAYGSVSRLAEDKFLLRSVDVDLAWFEIRRARAIWTFRCNDANARARTACSSLARLLWPAMVRGGLEARDLKRGPTTRDYDWRGTSPWTHLPARALARV